jgi:hypothetical protein
MLRRSESFFIVGQLVLQMIGLASWLFFETLLLRGDVVERRIK